GSRFFLARQFARVQNFLQHLRRAHSQAPSHAANPISRFPDMAWHQYGGIDRDAASTTPANPLPRIAPISLSTGLPPEYAAQSAVRPFAHRAPPSPRTPAQALPQFPVAC